MPDIFVKVGNVEVTGDGKKVPAKFATKAKTTMAEAGAKVIKNTSGVTADGKPEAPGYSVDIRLEEVIFGTNTVTAIVKGVINTAPKAELKRSINARTKIAGDTSDGAVYDAIAASTTDLIKVQALPAIKQMVSAP